MPPVLTFGSEGLDFFAGRPVMSLEKIIDLTILLWIIAGINVGLVGAYWLTLKSRQKLNL